MSFRRATQASLALLLAGSTCVAASTASAQPRVTVRLLSQTPWTFTSDNPNKSPILDIVVTATNVGSARFGELEVAVAIGERISSRFDYERSLSEGPGAIMATNVTPFNGRLDPAKARTFTVHVDMNTMNVDPIDSAVYPARVEIRSGGVEVGALNTPVINLVRRPQVPVLFSWWTEFAAPPAFDAEGRLVDPAFEAAIQPEVGSLSEQVSAIEDLAADPDHVPPIDVVIQPSTVEDLVRMADGYQRYPDVQVPAGQGASLAASILLEALARAIAPQSVQASATPFANPSIPVMLNSDLGADLEEQRALGGESVFEILGVPPADTVAEPAEGALNDAALQWLSSHGATTILAQPDTVDRPLQDYLEPPPAATVVTQQGDALSLVLPDPSTQRLLERPDLLEDPVRAAQIVLAELAVIWREAPVPASGDVRGLALQLDPRTMPAPIWAPLLSRLGSAPFLRKIHAQDMAPQIRPVPEVVDLRNPTDVAFSETYADRIRQLGRDVNAYGSMLTEPSPLPDRLRSDLYQAQSVTVGNEPAGQAWLDQVASITSDAFARTTPGVSQVFTFTSAEGSIPLRMSDPGPVPLQVHIELQSSHFDFPDGNSRDVTLQRPDQIVTFEAVAKSTGLNPILVRVRSPSGKVISEQQLNVRTTALNSWALLITTAAALMLLVLWIRRWVRRRTT